MTHYSDYYFTSNKSGWLCPGFTQWKCEPPNACAREPTTGKVYCCDHSDEVGNVCWSVESECTVGETNLYCGGGDSTWCCLDETEECTQAENQGDICWNKERSPLANISGLSLNNIYSSLSSQQPSATTWHFDPQSLIPPTSTDTLSPIDTSARSTSAPTPTTAATEDTISQSISDSSKSLSGGAIAGIVVGVVVALAIALGGAAFLLKRHRGRQKPASGLAPAEMAHEGAVKQQRYEADSNPVNIPQPAQELPAPDR